MSSKPTPSTPPDEVRNFSTTLRVRHRSQRGIAIITVLAVLLLMTVLILAFFKMAQSELYDAQLYSESVRTRQLSDVVTSLVIAQIRQATNTELAGNRYTWASQPGAITQFHSVYRNGTDYQNMAATVYKLYSSKSMTADGGVPSDNLAFDVPPDWDERDAQFVDLNEPIYNSTKERLYFPIIDPRGYAAKIQEGKIHSSNIEGFHYSSVNSRNRQIAGVIEPGAVDEDQQRLPMPVEWMYMLADGTLGYLDDNNAFVPPNNGSVPDEKNPIVARVAFWTDDETAKININVASEGAFWDIPRADSQTEREYGRYQPARNEVYRYPGHPAGISLSTILYPGSGDPTRTKAAPYLNDFQYQRILELSPKSRWYNDGSGIGNRIPTRDEGGGSSASIKYIPGNSRLYATVDEMLFEGADPGGERSGTERRLNPIFEQNSRALEAFEYGRHSLTVNSNAPEITLFGTPRICLWPMKDERRPVLPGRQTAVPQQTYYDRLISFAATVGPRRYFWQKNNPGSRHNEIYNASRGENMELLDAYMMNLAKAPIPGYGGSFERKYGRGNKFSDTRQIMVQIWDYMRNTNLNDPLLNPSHHYNSITSMRGGPAETRNRIGRGQIAGSCLCGGTSDHRDVWWQVFNPYAKGHGRVYTLTEVAMVFHARAASNGTAIGDQYAGSALSAGEKLIEIGLLLETFSVAHGFTTIQPKSRIVVAGRVDVDNRDGNLFVAQEDYPTFQIKNIDDEWITFPVMRGTNPQDFQPNPNPDRRGQVRPGVMARWDSGDNYVGARFWGGHGGVRLFSADVEGVVSGDNLFNPGSHQNQPQLVDTDTLAWRTVLEEQGPNQAEAVRIAERNGLPQGIVVNAAAPTISFRGPKEPLAIVLYDTGKNRSSTVNNLIQVFYVSFDTTNHPEGVMQIPAPQVPSDGTPFKWEDRIRACGTDVNKLISRTSDTTRSMLISHGDFRLMSGRRVGTEEIWAKHPKFDDPSARHAHSLTAMDGSKLPGYSADRGYALRKDGTPVDYGPKQGPQAYRYYPDFGVADPDSDEFFRRESREQIDYELSIDPGVTGDWDAGIGAHIDGPYINRPDDGTNGADISGDPYFDNVDKIDEVHRTFFAPNRVVASSGQLGSIATGIQMGIPWRTLLFRPDAEHFGSRNYPRIGDVPDHVMMDFFWMPVVEPFPISQPFATMGKVNLNYRIVPFDYIKRATAMHAVLKDQRMMAIKNDQGDKYLKQGGDNYRYPIDIPTTLLQFEDRFSRGEVFRSATEICEIYMIPRTSGAPNDRNTLGTPKRAEIGGKGYDYPTMRDFWKEHSLTADNVKERTYTNIYPRVTTKSNVFKTHMIVESIQKVRSVAHDVFDPERDQITGRWRGSAVIERNIDPAKIEPGPGSVPDYFQDPKFNVLPSMEAFYAYRVLDIKEFNP